MSDEGYLAGLIDGEGCIDLHRRRASKRTEQFEFYYVLRIRISNTAKGLIDWLTIRFGGHSSEQKAKSKKWKKGYIWSIYGAKAKEILLKALPYLKVKKKQAELALVFQSTITYGPLALKGEIVELRKTLYEEMKKLNRKGRDGN